MHLLTGGPPWLGPPSESPGALAGRAEGRQKRRKHQIPEHTQPQQQKHEEQQQQEQQQHQEDHQQKQEEEEEEEEQQNQQHQQQQQGQRWTLRNVGSPASLHMPMRMQGINRYSLRGPRAPHCSTYGAADTTDGEPAGVVASPSACRRSSSNSECGSSDSRINWHSNSRKVSCSSRSSNHSRKNGSNTSSGTTSSRHPISLPTGISSNSSTGTSRRRSSSSSSSNSNNNSNSSRSASPACPLCRGSSIFRHGSRLERREALLQQHGLGALGGLSSLASVPSAAADSRNQRPPHRQHPQSQHRSSSNSSSSSCSQQQQQQQQRGAEQRREIEALRRCLLSGLMKKERQRYLCPFCCWQGEAATTTAAAAAAESSSSSCWRFVARKGLEAEAATVQYQLQQQQLIDVDSLAEEQQQQFFVKQEPLPHASSSGTGSSSSSSSSSGAEALRVACEGLDCRSLSTEAKSAVAELVKDGCFISTALQAAAAVQQQQQQQRQQQQRLRQRPQQRLQGRGEMKGDPRGQQEASERRSSFAAACAATAAEMEAEAVSQQLLDLGALRAREEADSRRDREAQQQQQQLASSAQPLWEQHGCLCSFLEAANPILFEALTCSSSSKRGKDDAGARGRVLLQRLFDLQQQLLRSYTSAAPVFVCWADEEAGRLMRALRVGDTQKHHHSIHDCLLIASAAAAAAGEGAAVAPLNAAQAAGGRTRSKPIPTMQEEGLQRCAEQQQQWPLSERQQQMLLMLHQQAQHVSAAELQLSLAKAYFVQQEKALVESAFFSNLGSLAAPSLLLLHRRQLLLLLGWWLRLSAFLTGTALELQQLLLLQQHAFANAPSQQKDQKDPPQRQHLVSLADLLLRPHPTRGPSYIQMLLLHPKDSSAAAAVASAASEAGAKLESPLQHGQNTSKPTAAAATAAAPPAAPTEVEEISSDADECLNTSSNSSSIASCLRSKKGRGAIAAASSSSIADEPRGPVRACRPLRAPTRHLPAASRRRLCSSSSSSRLQSFARCLAGCSTAEQLAAQLWVFSTDSSFLSPLENCCYWDVCLPETPGMQGLQAADRALLPLQQQHEEEELCPWDALARLWYLTSDPFAAECCSPRVLQQGLQQQMPLGASEGSSGRHPRVIEEARQFSLEGFPSLVATGLWLPAVAFVSPVQQQQHLQRLEQQQQQQVRERLLWGRRQLIHYISLLLPQPPCNRSTSAASPARAYPHRHISSSNNNTSSSGGVTECLPAFRWLRGAMKAVAEGTEQKFLQEAVDDFVDDLFIS